jgi:DNA-binding beta-propeller fold protein YncE
MRRIFLLAAVSALALAGLNMSRGHLVPESSVLAGGASAGGGGGRVVVANRGSGTISVIDAGAGVVIGTHALPSGPHAPEPMYVTHSPAHGRVFVGDRRNSRVVVFDARDFSVEATVPAGSGVFHMWDDDASQQLWVNNDLDKTVTVIDTGTLEVVTTFPLPADLVAAGGRPHDVVLDPTNDSAFVSMIGLPGPSDYVVRYSAETFQETGRAAVGKDPHLSLSHTDERLFVPCQGSGQVFVLERRTMTQLDAIGIPAAHGAGMSRDGRRFYTTNITGGGSQGLWAIDARTGAVLGAADTPYNTPHNVALTPDGRKLFVTHSGANDKVTIYTASAHSPVPAYAGEVTVGSNPFGIAFIHGAVGGS